MKQVAVPIVALVIALMFGGLVEPGKAKLPVISTDGDIYFFVNAPIGSGDAAPKRANFTVFKRTNGGV